MSVILTCVYCGKEYPTGTPSHSADILTAHIKVCEKHPLRKAEADILKLRKALTLLMGTEDPGELKLMEATMMTLPGPEDYKAAGIHAIHALLETM